MQQEEFFSENFTNLNSPLFAESNVNKIYHEAKKNSLTDPISIASIHQLKSQVEALSKLKEIRLLRGAKRKISTRSWTSHGPRHLLIADLAFLKKLNTSTSGNQSHRTLFLCMDHFSKLIFMKFQHNRSSAQTLKSFLEALDFFTNKNKFENTYRLLAVDRGGILSTKHMPAHALTCPHTPCTCPTHALM